MGDLEADTHALTEAEAAAIIRAQADETAGALVIEARLTAWLAPHLPLAIPAYRYAGRPGAAFPRSFAGYDKLAGTPALLVGQGSIDLAATGRRIGGFLRKELR